MLQNVRHFVRACSQIVRKCELSEGNFLKDQWLKTRACELRLVGNNRTFYTNSPRMKDQEEIDIRRAAKEKQRKDRGVSGESSVDLDFAAKSSAEMFPSADLPDAVFNGIPFRNLPILCIMVSRNNTIMTLTDQGATKFTRSCGQEGFKNTKKGTNIAAQTLGVSFALRVIKKGYKTVRILMKGLGPGRMSSVKGLQIGGLNIVSITDRSNDLISMRPKKQRRL